MLRSVVANTPLPPALSVRRAMELPGAMETVFGNLESVSAHPVLSVVASTLPPLALHVLRVKVLPGVMETVFGNTENANR